jgi:hypothetical protein
MSVHNYGWHGPSPLNKAARKRNNYYTEELAFVIPLNNYIIHDMNKVNLHSLHKRKPEPRWDEPTWLHCEPLML